MFQTETVTFYAFYASALINDDYSGLEDFEEEQLKEFLHCIEKTYGPDARIVACSEDATCFGFPDYRGVFPLSGEVIDYTVLYTEE